MILDKKNTIEFLHSRNQHPAKGEMRTISNLIEVGRKVGYQIKKIGVDQFEIIPNYIIKDYNKPVFIRSSLPKEIDQNYVVDGKPWIKIVEDTINGYCDAGFMVICYLFTLKDGDIIDKNKVTDRGIAIAQYLGYINENEDFIYINYYPNRIDKGGFDWNGE